MVSSFFSTFDSAPFVRNSSKDDKKVMLLHNHALLFNVVQGITKEYVVPMFIHAKKKSLFSILLQTLFYPNILFFPASQKKTPNCSYFASYFFRTICSKTFEALFLEKEIFQKSIKQLLFVSK